MAVSPRLPGRSHALRAGTIFPQSGPDPPEALGAVELAVGRHAWVGEMVPLVCSQQQKFALRSQVPEKPPVDALSPCSPLLLPISLSLLPLQPGAVCSLAGDGFVLH